MSAHKFFAKATFLYKNAPITSHTHDTHDTHDQRVWVRGLYEEPKVCGMRVKHTTAMR